MSGIFKNILIPVDFSVNTEVVLRHANDLACANGSTIHLLHVIQPTGIRKVIRISNHRTPSLDTKYYRKALKGLEELKNTIEENNLTCNVKIQIRRGNVHNNIQAAAMEINPQLLIIGKRNNYKYFTFLNSVRPNEIAKVTGYPVLTVMTNSVESKIKIMVLPVGSFIPKRKIELAVEFAKKYRTEIHLVTTASANSYEDSDRNSFLETYKILRSGLTNPIEHHILRGNNFPKAILKYAEWVGADLIFVNPDIESKISNLTGKHLNDLLTASSKLKILSIEPYRESKAGVLLSVK